MRTRNVSEYMLVLALCLVKGVVPLIAHSMLLMIITDMTASGTDENVRSSAPVSSEQISVSEMDESQFVSQAATTTEPSAAAEESEHPASTPTQPPVLTGNTRNSAYKS